MLFPELYKKAATKLGTTSEEIAEVMEAIGDMTPAQQEDLKAAMKKLAYEMSQDEAKDIEDPANKKKKKSRPKKKKKKKRGAKSS